MHKHLYLVGYASGIAGADSHSGGGPLILKNSAKLLALSDLGLMLDWQTIIQAPENLSNDIFLDVQQLAKKLSENTFKLTQQKKFFLVLGGDHTSAIGTWSGAANALRSQGKLGLIWVDAHMDSHTPITTQSGHLHGMPLASLLGYGDPRLTTLGGLSSALQPENICLIGVRSFEPGEAELLKKLNVRIFFMDEVEQRGLRAVFKEALQIASSNTVGYGISLDIDGIDPADAPGTGVAEPNGLLAKEICQELTLFANDPNLIGFEIVEFDPSRDKNNKTEKLIADLIAAISL